MAELHVVEALETTMVGDKECSLLQRVRVPGGWLYQVRDWRTLDVEGQPYAMIVAMSSTFVPDPPTRWWRRWFGGAP